MTFVLVKGKIKYVPDDALREIQSIMGADRLHSEAEAFRRMADNSRRDRGILLEAGLGVDFGPLGVRKRRRS